MKATEQEIAILLERAGISPVRAAGSRSKAAAEGGVIARMFVQGRDNPELSMIVGDVRCAAHLPIDEERAVMMVETLIERHAVPHEARFQHMLIDLLVRITRMYMAADATSLSLDPVHLHKNGYHVDRVVLTHERPLHLKPRVESTGRDSTFTHTHRN